MSVFVANITIPIGADFEQSFFLENATSNSPLNLTGYTGSSAMKKHPASMTTAANFEVSFPNLTNGQIKISLASSLTSALKPGRYCYDILLNDGSKKTRAVEGSALVTGGITTG